MASDEIRNLQATAARSKALRDTLSRNWPDAVSAMHNVVFTLVHEFNDAPDYTGQKLEDPRKRDSGELAVTGVRPSLEWKMAINNLTRQAIVTCTLGDRTAGEKAPRRTTGTLRYNNDE